MVRATVIFTLILVPLGGCEQSSKIKDPVAPPPPRRTLLPSGANGAAALQDHRQSADAQGDPVRPVSHAPTASSPLLNSDLANANPNTLMLARAEGKPIFLRDVLDNVGAQLAADRAQLSQDQFRAAQHERIAEGLRLLVERELILQQAKRELKEPQLKLIRNEAAKEFKKRVRTLMEQMQVNTESELNARLVKDGMSLDRLKKAHQDNFVTHQFLQSKVSADMTVSRREMIDYYREHIDKFTDPPRVKWQQLALTTSPDHLTGQASRCRCGACDQARRFRAKLDSGADFDELARDHSDGPRKEHGGHWDWTAQDSLADPMLNTALFALPPGHISPVLEGTDSLHILRVLERDAGGVRSFRLVQDEIRTTLRRQKLQQATERYLATLYEKADVEYTQPELQPDRRAQGAS